MHKGLLVVGLIGTVIFCQCASKVTPPGGPKDETPPQIVFDKSTPNQQIRFTERTITITLDEWIELEDASNQVLVSPPLSKRPEIRIKGRAVVFKFHDEEVLRENATYTINFGEAIRDITEKNVLKNFSFVFSTGEVIDSLSIQGNIVDAYSGEPVENATIMLYESLEDSIPMQEKPFYATRSDKSGYWQVRNMKGGSFMLAAVVDDNLNYLLDPSERIAFPDTFVLVRNDTGSMINLRMFEPRASLLLDRRDTSGWNQAVFTYNRNPSELQVNYQDPDESLWVDRSDQTVTVWYFSEVRREWPLYLTIDSLEIDTLVLRYDQPGPKMQKLKKVGKLSNSAHPADPFNICFDRPILQFDTSKMLLLEGRNAKNEVPFDLSINDSLPMCLSISRPWVPDSSYQLLLLPGSLIDFFQLENDTISEVFPIGNLERFGTINLKMEGLSVDHSYLVEIGIKDKVEIQFLVDSTTEYSRSLPKLKPATYEIRVTEDRNRNGRWDPGSLLQRVQPERTQKETMEALRANWDLEVNYKWSNQ